jgi:hypothetical protein
VKITHIDIIEAVMPFTDGGAAGTGIMTTRWDTLEAVFVRLQTDTGLVGWGECFAYSCRSAVAASARDMVAPLLLGRELPATPEALPLEIQQRLHLFGRYGVTMFAISGFDIALWDLAAKAQQKPLHALLGPALRSEVNAYASLVRYADTELIQKQCRQALAQGYRSIKLHEVDPAVMRAARAACGPDIGISVDVNCAWTPAQAQEKLAVLQEIGATWVEEPIFPPEDIRNQAMLNRQFPLGAGENACTRHAFARIIEALGDQGGWRHRIHRGRQPGQGTWAGGDAAFPVFWCRLLHHLAADGRAARRAAARASLCRTGRRPRRWRNPAANGRQGGDTAAAGARLHTGHGHTGPVSGGLRSLGYIAPALLVQTRCSTSNAQAMPGS